LTHKFSRITLKASERRKKRIEKILFLKKAKKKSLIGIYLRHIVKASNEIE